MITVDVLICTINKGIVRLLDNLIAPREGVHYIIAYQYTDERYLELVSEALTSRPDVLFSKYRGKGLSANRNNALRLATSDVVLFADDDARYSSESFDIIQRTFEANPDLDVAFFQASTYTNRPLKEYPPDTFDYATRTTKVDISALETACKRTSIQGRLSYDERFGLGSEFVCGEEDIWLTDAERQGLKMRYFPLKIVETSTMLKQKMIYVDAAVQVSFGAITYYRYGSKAWWLCFHFASKAAGKGLCHFFPMLKNLYEGIHLYRRSHK